MSLRRSAPKARLPDTHIFVTVSRGEKARVFGFRPGALYAAAAALPLLAAAYFSTTVYLIYRDDMLAGMMNRQTEMQYAYEDRIAALRAQMDRVTSRQLLDQTSFEGKLHALLSRQAQLESRGATMATLATQAGVGTETTGSIPKAEAPKAAETRGAGRRAMLNPLLRAQGGPALPLGAMAFADAGAARAFAPGKPAPLSGDDPATPDAAAEPAAPPSALVGAADLPASEQLKRIAASMDDVELRQVRQLSVLEARARRSAQGYRAAIEAAGLDLDTLKAPADAAAVGGPFTPLKLDRKGSLFEREAARVQDALVDSVRVARLMPFMPLRRPLGEGAQQTSPFGARVDPFLGRAAFHGGLDFRDAVGAPIRATAAGEVVTAGWVGGYGNMVEVSHGNGLSTRYGHMSAISVSVGDHVSAGSVVGKLGSTGRSTGPHLHYEVRVDGEAVDPARFLKAGASLFGRAS
jgi:murein DD-endopeptidase MepM/ murein hydrolase activator NlpD